MGIFSNLFYNRAVITQALEQPKPYRSPFVTSNLTKVATDNFLGLTATQISRTDAMKIPPVTRGRGLICGTLSRYPLALFEYQGAEVNGKRLEPLPFMTSTKTNQAPSQRMLWTLDDILFLGMSVWAVERDKDGNILDAIRVLPEQWSIDPDTLGVKVNGQPASKEEVIIFEGPQEGIIYLADEKVQASRNLANALQLRLKSPIPLMELHNTDANDDMDVEEITDLIDQYETARQDSGTAYTPYNIEARPHGDVKSDLYIEGRNADRLDWANILGLPAAMLDGSMSTATLTYSTSEGKRSEFVDYSLSYWASSVEARLSQDDVTPDGTYCRFDLNWLVNPTQSGTNPPTED